MEPIWSCGDCELRNSEVAARGSQPKWRQASTNAPRTDRTGETCWALIPSDQWRSVLSICGLKHIEVLLKHVETLPCYTQLRSILMSLLMKYGTIKKARERDAYSVGSMVCQRNSARGPRRRACPSLSFRLNRWNPFRLPMSTLRPKAHAPTIPNSSALANAQWVESKRKKNRSILRPSYQDLQTDSPSNQTTRQDQIRESRNSCTGRIG